VQPLGYLPDHPNGRIDELLPWAYICTPKLKAVAFYRPRRQQKEIPCRDGEIRSNL
jgi:hypothetical protein